MAPPIVHEALRSSGRPLGDQDRRRFETQLGIGLADVRLHTDGLAAASSKAVGAEAYTAGSHVVFGRGAYAPDSPGGQRLLAHELAHVAQQGAGGGVPAQLEVGRSDDPAEHEAERFAESVTGSTPAATPRVEQTARRDVLARYSHRDCAEADLSGHVWPADGLARQMTAKALGALAASPISPSATALFPKYFMTGTPNIAAIQRVFQAVSDEFADNDYTYECEDSCESTDNGYTWGGIVGALTSSHIHLCMNNFRSRSNECLARTIVHEFTHRYAGTDDNGYCKSGCGNSSCPSSLTAAKALENADSYACFAYELWPMALPAAAPSGGGTGGGSGGGSSGGGSGGGSSGGGSGGGGPGDAGAGPVDAGLPGGVP